MNQTAVLSESEALVRRIARTVSDHNAYRKRCIGLVPTENVLSPLAQQMLTTDLSHRYLFQNPQWRYVGGKHLGDLEEHAKQLARQVFGAEYVNVRPLSGENCTNIVIDSVVDRGDTFYHVAAEDGGHFAAKAVAERIGATRRLLPYDRARATFDIDACREAFARDPPDVIYIDASMMLFEHPIRELRAIAADAIIVYDASQVLGLIAGGAFQDPLEQGADVLSGSTHKSLPGPQKGIILTNRADIMDRIEETIFPGHVSNFHLHHVGALAVTLAETVAHGSDYAHQMVRNAQAFAAELDRLGFEVQGRDRGYTRTHQVWIDITGHWSADEAVDLLHEANLIANVNLIPTIRAKGLRLGVPEVTRLGMREDEMRRIAGFMHDVLIERQDASKVRERVMDLALRFHAPTYCFSP